MRNFTGGVRGLRTVGGTDNVCLRTFPSVFSKTCVLISSDMNFFFKNEGDRSVPIIMAFNHPPLYTQCFFFLLIYHIHITHLKTERAAHNFVFNMTSTQIAMSYS